ncbi:MAG: sigma-70 family RNA polymerase sigma factor [Anaerolineales bacterium]|nr:MAG: sigma-70 family RNA polymerase sigma factor [Anaerolineales bacterium]
MSIDDLSTQFPTFQRELKSFLLRITASMQDAEDIVQETYLKAQLKSDTFNGESSLKTWVFSIASNLAKDLLRSQKRWPETVTDICREESLGNHEFFQEAMHIRQTSPQGQFEIKEHIAFCFTCISKSLPLEGHLVILLKEVYDFKVKEIAQILQLSEAMAKYHLHASRTKMMDIFDHRCSLINKEGICHQCTELNGIFNPKQKTQEELIKLELVREAEHRSRDELLDLRMNILRELDPFTSGAAELQLHHLEHNRQVMAKYLEENA